jgi:hypothetical protein
MPARLETMPGGQGVRSAAELLRAACAGAQSVLIEDPKRSRNSHSLKGKRA